jgi:hypothetical protein
MRSPVGAELASALGQGARGVRPSLKLDVERPVRITRHDWRRAAVDLPAFAACGVPTDTMGRSLIEDPLFFGAALAGGVVLGQLTGQSRRNAPQTRSQVETDTTRSPRAGRDTREERLDGRVVTGSHGSQEEGAIASGAKLQG